ncbi:MAG: hypothetical protein A2939_02165 [Parcubacteria group bacterium RIFCSPLOWO2_01_FULL_48_18]|nr:MAG: hypothetical protein A2939_02165 [Parcubacteria group bacterium RIFCSPLOWO2_01_FULL_48_18]
MRPRTSSIALFIALFFAGTVIACTAASTGPVETDQNFSIAATDADTMLHVAGSGDLSDVVLVINALRHFNGSAMGAVVVPAQRSAGGRAGDVLEVVPPNATYDHWCVNAALVEVDGFNVQIYVRDIGDGRSAFDQVAFQGSFNTSCTTSPAPEPEAEFQSLLGGDFKTTIRTR